MKNLKFKQISAATGSFENGRIFIPEVFGLTDDGKVYKYYEESKNWYPLSMEEDED